MPHLIDRRLAGKNKTISNRERFLNRYRDQIRQKVAEAIRDQTIKDLGSDTSVSIPRRDVSEPSIRHGQGGIRDMVHSGNKEYVTGDRIKRPDGGQGGGGKAAQDGEGEDDFVFQLTREEFMQYLFDGLELPRLARTEAVVIPEQKNARAGFTASGSPTNLSVIRSLRNAIGRRIALSTPLSARLRELEAELADLRQATPPDDDRIEALMKDVASLKARIRAVPYLDPTDLRFVNRTRVPHPCVQAVMFCVMDVSGSMDEARKDLSKRFFLMLYLFLTRSYERVEVVFIRHHTQADEVDENTFFHSRESGGTVVSSALELMAKIAHERFPANEWNIYAAQASDGDNWDSDTPKCIELLKSKILPVVRHYAYIQVAQEEQNLWQQFQGLVATHPFFAMRKVGKPADIYPVFRDLFKKREAAA